MAQTNTHRELPHCPKCTDDVILDFIEETHTDNGKMVIVPIAQVHCPSCDYTARSIDPETVRVGVEQNMAQMVVGQRRRMRIRGDGHIFSRYDHLELKYDARDYFYYPRLGGEDQDGFLCPVFFDKDVLVYFNNHPKYRLVMRSSSAGSIMQGDEPLLSQGFGINRSGKLFMWLGDIARALSGPEVKRELDIFKAHNVDSDHDLASTYFFSQNPGELYEAFFESDNEAKVFDLIDEINTVFTVRFGAALFKVDIQRLAEAYRLPVLEDRQQIFQAFMSLNINLVENMDHARFRSVLLGHGVKKVELLTKDGNELRSNKLLQLLLERVLCMSPQDAYSTMTPLFVVNDLRQLHGHLKDASFEKDYMRCKKALGLPPESSDLEVHSRLVELLNTSLTRIRTAITSEGKIQGAVSEEHQ